MLSHFLEFVGLYLRYFAVIDCVIWVLGIAALVFQCMAVFGGRQDHREGSARVRVEERIRLAHRLGVSAVDALPLLGLFGTVVALLMTFETFGQGAAAPALIATFAPGLTTTISGLLTALLNLICLQLILRPQMSKLLVSV